MIVLIFQCISCHIHIWSRWLFTAKLPNLIPTITLQVSIRNKQIIIAVFCVILDIWTLSRVMSTTNQPISIIRIGILVIHRINRVSSGGINLQQKDTT